MPTIILPARKKTAKRNIEHPRTRSKRVIKMANTNACDTNNSSYHSSGLVIVIPAVKHAKSRNKRAREIEEEDGTLVAPLSKRPRKAASCSSDHFMSYNDDETLISSALPKSSAHPILSKLHSTIPVQRSEQEPCSYIGPFNLYAMDHQDLCEIYRPAGSSEPQYEVLYRFLRRLETSPDTDTSTSNPESTSTSSYRTQSPCPSPPQTEIETPCEPESHAQKLTATITLPPTPYGRKFGSAHAPCLHDPTTHRAYPLELTRISHVNQVFYRDAEKACFEMRYNDDVEMVGRLPGVSAKVGVTATDARQMGVVESAGGFHMSRVWEGKDEDGDVDATDGEVMELFEGYMGLRVGYSREYERMGYGRGVDVGFAFWAVRRR